MDEKTTITSQLPIDRLSHTPEAGFTDIKPLQFDFTNSNNLIQNTLLAIALAFFIYLVFLQLKRRNKKQNKIVISPKEEFNNSLEKLATYDLSLRDHCEFLTLTFKKLISALVISDLNHLTPRPFYARFLDIAKIKLNDTSEKILTDMAEGSYKLLVKLENGEYGDDLMHQTINQQKSQLTARVLELGNEIFKIFDQRAKEKSK